MDFSGRPAPASPAIDPAGVRDHGSEARPLGRHRGLRRDAGLGLGLPGVADADQYPGDGRQQLVARVRLHREYHRDLERHDRQPRRQSLRDRGRRVGQFAARPWLGLVRLQRQPRAHDRGAGERHAERRAARRRNGATTITLDQQCVSCRADERVDIAGLHHRAVGRVDVDGHGRLRNGRRHGEGRRRLHGDDGHAHVRAGSDVGGGDGADPARCEPQTNETFQLDLANPIGATLGQSQGTATITAPPLSPPPPPPPVPPPPANSGGTATFQVTSDWGSGFQGQITVTNTSTTVWNAWTVTFNFPYQITSVWDASLYSHTGNTYVIQNASYDGALAPGSFGELRLHGDAGPCDGRDLERERPLRRSRRPSARGPQRLGLDGARAGGGDCRPGERFRPRRRSDLARLGHAGTAWRGGGEQQRDGHIHADHGLPGKRQLHLHDQRRPWHDGHGRCDRDGFATDLPRACLCGPTST